LGRRTLLEPIEWTDDGWFLVQAGASSRAIPKPAGAAGDHGFAYSDDISTNRMGLQWSFYAGDEADRTRVRHADGALVLRAEGAGPATSSPLWFVAGDQAYEVEVDIDADPGASGTTGTS
jgi:xylan 1,4-beta-xylosidase